MPEGAVYVGRPTKWGNPYRLSDGSNRPWAVDRFRAAVLRGQGNVMWPAEIRADLAGKDLVCWCPLDQPCHADVLLEVANATEAG